MIDTLKTLCCLSGVSGTEDEVRDYILERAMLHADAIRTDSMGNLLVYKRGKFQREPAPMICAHMDEVGLIVTYITEDGYLRFDAIGSIDRRVLIGKKVYVGANRVSGVIGIRAYHLVDKEEEKKVPKLDALYIDIGADSRDAAIQLVRLGDTAVFDDNVLEFGEGLLKAKALDSRVGCAVMLQLLEKPLPCDTWFAFTVQEHVGLRGAEVAARQLSPETVLILDGIVAADLPGISEANRICELGKGAVLPIMDKGTIYTPALVGKLAEFAEWDNIVFQRKSKVAGRTEAAAVQKSGVGARTVLIGCPIRYMHTPTSVINCSDFEEVLKLAYFALGALAEETI